MGLFGRRLIGHARAVPCLEQRAARHSELGRACAVGRAAGSSLTRTGVVGYFSCPGGGDGRLEHGGAVLPVGALHRERVEAGEELHAALVICASSHFE